MYLYVTLYWYNVYITNQIISCCRDYWLLYKSSLYEAVHYIKYTSGYIYCGCYIGTIYVKLYVIMDNPNIMVCLIFLMTKLVTE